MPTDHISIFQYRKEKDSTIKERLLAILLLYDGKSIYEVAKIIRRSERTIKEWLKRWNERGYEGILPKVSKRGLDFDEMIERSEGVALDIFGERKLKE